VYEITIFNLESPNTIKTKCDLEFLDEWLLSEIESLKDSIEKSIVIQVCKNLERFIMFPKRPLLLWKDCNRIPEKGKKQKIHCYPMEFDEIFKQINTSKDTRPNGPAVAAFLYAGGVRPQRFGSNNQWSIHHVYSGKFPYLNKLLTLHAQKDGFHFTQSAGLVAIHPIADQMVDEYPFFTWYLRAKIYQMFKYDPDGAFNMNSNSVFGFPKEISIAVIFPK